MLEHFSAGAEDTPGIFHARLHHHILSAIPWHMSHRRNNINISTSTSTYSLISLRQAILSLPSLSGSNRAPIGSRINNPDTTRLCGDLDINTRGTIVAQLLWK